MLLSFPSCFLLWSFITAILTITKHSLFFPLYIFGFFIKKLVVSMYIWLFYMILLITKSVFLSVSCCFIKKLYKNLSSGIVLPLAVLLSLKYNTITFLNILKFLLCKYFTYLVRVILRHFVFFEDCVNGVAYLISFSVCLSFCIGKMLIFVS